MKRVILYPKSALKPIILTDNESSTEGLQNAIFKALSSVNLTTLKTAKDTLVIRPSEIQAVLITECNDDSQEDRQLKE
jgi:hypothetical protein